ncbi:glutamine amidotransferase [Marinobacter mobilis]|uniref:glutamine amidotransferase n=1 Tax=Marinobacter mobilis TaxID=488533 RepID=UPI0035C785D7
MTRIAILKTGSTYPALSERYGDFEDWFQAALAGNDSNRLDIHTIHVAEGDEPGDPGQWDGVIVTGSPALVSERAPWSEVTAQWLAMAVKAGRPVLGVCYGHQLLAHALGGKVGYHPDGRESGTFLVRLNGKAASDPLMSGLPECFPAQLTHLQSVLELPPGATLLASSDHEPHQAFRYGDHVWGVQFHPEFSAEVMRAYLEVQTPALQKEGLDPQALINAVTATPDAGSLLPRFAERVMQRP